MRNSRSARSRRRIRNRNRLGMRVILLMGIVALLISALPVLAVAKGSLGLSPYTGDYQLTNALYTAVKSVLNEPTDNGSRIAVVLRLYNASSQITQVPDLDLNVRMTDGTAYTLFPSDDNPGSIQPKEIVEVTYLLNLSRHEPFQIKTVFWAKADKFVYPKKETPVLTIPAADMEWPGQDAELSSGLALQRWGMPFQISVLSSAIQYTPVQELRQHTPQGTVELIGLLAENRSQTEQWIPDFRVDGASDRRVYEGKRVEQGALRLQPGEQRYIHYAIPVTDDAQLKRLVVLTPEQFTFNGTTTAFYIGRLGIAMPLVRSYAMFTPGYVMGSPIRIDPLNTLIPANVSVALDDLQLYQGNGFKAIVGKFDLLNQGNQPVQVPDFQTVLTGAGGAQYIGTRQSLASDTLIPNLHYVVDFYYLVSNQETGAKVTMSLMDGQTASPYEMPIAAFKTQVGGAASDALDFYPYRVSLSDWQVLTRMSPMTSSSGFSYTYELNMNVKVSSAENVVADGSFAKMEADLTDENGQRIGQQFYAFTGDQALESGSLSAAFPFSQYSNSLKLNLYETISTPFGDARRLLKSFRD